MSRKHRDRRDRDEMRLETNKSGFGGADACRSFAERTYAPERRQVNMHVPESASAPDREKMRLYKKGGSVKRCHKDMGGLMDTSRQGADRVNDITSKFSGVFKKGGKVKHHGLNRDQVNEHFPRHAKTMKSNQPSLEREEHKKQGGHVRRQHKAGGGFLGGLFGGGQGGNPLQGLGDLAGKFLGVRDNMAGTLVPMMFGLKKGGHVKRRHKFDGGSMDMSAPGAIPVTAVPGMQGQQQRSGMLGSNTMQNAKRGGKMVRKAKGGSVYTREMVGEHPSRKRPHFNYEAEMRGEHASRKPAMRTSSKAGLRDESKGTVFKRGGKVKREHKFLGGLLGGGGGGGGPIGNIAKMILPGFAGELIGSLGIKKGGSVNRDRAMRAHKAMGGMGRYSDGGMADIKPEGKMIKRAGGGMGRFAAGGVAKQRHGQATKRGTQMPNKRVPRGGGC